MGNVPEPDTRHYIHKDIYTPHQICGIGKLMQIVWMDFRPAKEFTLKQGDSFHYPKKVFLKLNRFNTGLKRRKYDKYMFIL
jgi:hypothetical protein